MFTKIAPSSPKLIYRIAAVTMIVVLVIFAPVVFAQATKSKQSASSRAAQKNAAPIDVAINKAERQVMLSQRAAKLYAQGALGVSPAKSDIQMMETIAQFESELAWLKSNAPNSAIAASIQEQAAAWAQLKTFIIKPPVRDNIDEVGDASESLYIKSKLTASAVEGLTTNPFDEIVSLSARQRVMIQRMGKLYMFERAGFKDAKKKI